MAKSPDKFKQIKIEDEILSEVGLFKAITAQGKKRPTLDSAAHKALVQKKYNDAKAMDDHITLFRVQDKPGLGKKEKDNHTVQGPNWTPPSSVGFVMGAQSEGHRVWSATKPTNDANGLLGNDGEPAIFARESMAALGAGWMARETQPHEQYGRTGRAPVAVFTPPSSPRPMSQEQLQNIMDVNAGWDDLPISLNKLAKLSTPISKKLTDDLKKSRLTREDVGEELINFVQNTKGVSQLVEKSKLSFAELHNTPINVVKELLQQEGVIKLLLDSNVQFSQLMELYRQYIDEEIEDSFLEFYNSSNEDSSDDSESSASSGDAEETDSEDEDDDVDDLAQDVKKKLDFNPEGEGVLDHDDSSYWYIYTKAAIDRILELRLQSANIDVTHARIIHPNYIFNEVTALAFTKELVAQISAVDIGTSSGVRPTLLIPVNINNQHWVGMTVEFLEGNVIVTYMDSEASSMPESLNEQLKAELIQLYPNINVEIVEKAVEVQQYNNCGLEVIENLIAAASGEEARVPQDEALAIHAVLYEQYLAEETYRVEKEKQERELEVMQAIWDEAQECSTESTSFGSSVLQYLSNLVVSIIPNDIVSSIYLMAKILTIGSSNCGVQTDTFLEPMLEKLDVFNSIPANVFGMLPRTDNMLSSEILNFLEPVETTGKIDKSWVE